MQEDSAASAEKLVENFQDVQVYFLDQIKQRFNFLEQKLTDIEIENVSLQERNGKLTEANEILAHKLVRRNEILAKIRKVIHKDLDREHIIQMIDKLIGSKMRPSQSGNVSAPESLHDGQEENIAIKFADDNVGEARDEQLKDRDEELEKLRKELENETMAKNELSGNLEILIEENRRLQDIANCTEENFIINFNSNLKSSSDEQLENLRKELENERMAKNELTGKMEILFEENLKLQGVVNGNYPVTTNPEKQVGTTVAAAKHNSKLEREYEELLGKHELLISMYLQLKHEKQQDKLDADKDLLNLPKQTIFPTSTAYYIQFKSPTTDQSSLGYLSTNYHFLDKSNIFLADGFIPIARGIIKVSVIGNNDAIISLQTQTGNFLHVLSEKDGLLGWNCLRNEIVAENAQFEFFGFKLGRDDALFAKIRSVQTNKFVRVTSPSTLTSERWTQAFANEESFSNATEFIFEPVTHFFHHIRSANGLENNESSLSRLIRNGAGHYQIRCTYITYNYPLYLAYDGSGQLIRCSGINQKTVLRLQWDAKSRTVSIFSPLLSKFLSFRNLPKPRLVFDSDFSNLYESKFELQLGIVDSAIRICPYGGSWGPIVFDPKNNNAIITQKIDTTIYQSNFYLESATKSQIEASYSK